MKLKASLESMRLRTLPLSMAGVLLGILLAVADWKVDLWTAILIVITTVCLQILSNLSNELGDVLRGTDTVERQGPQYGLNSGEMTVRDMKVHLRGALHCVWNGHDLARLRDSVGHDPYPGAHAGCRRHHGGHEVYPRA